MTNSANAIEQLDAKVAEAAQHVEQQKPSSFIQVRRFDDYVREGLLMDAPQELIRNHTWSMARPRC